MIPEPLPVATAACAMLELYVGGIQQLFNTMDPAPFRERDPKAEQFIVVKPHADERHGQVERQPRARHVLHFPFDAGALRRLARLGEPASNMLTGCPPGQWT
jgi:hypothetical protein